MDNLIKGFLEFGKDRNYKEEERSSLISPFFKDEFNLSAGHQILMPAILSNVPQPIKRIIINEPCLRRVDFEKLGASNIHLLLFEMGVFGIFGEKKNEDENRFSILEDCVKYLGCLKLKNENIVFSVSNGAEILNHKFDPDAKSFEMLVQLGVKESNIIKTFGRQNFIFSKGDKRPSGYSIEIFYNYNNQFIEIGSINIYEYVYINKEFTKNLTNFGIGCGFGFERLQFIIEGKSSVYDLDIYSNITKQIQKEFNTINFSIIKERVIKIIELVKTLLFIYFDGQRPDKSPHGKIMKQFVSKLYSEINYLNLNKSEIDLIINNLYSDYSDRYGIDNKFVKLFKSFINEEVF